MSSTMVDASNLTKTFGSLSAVDHININIKKSEIFGFLGPNGAGKTTTARALVLVSARVASVRDASQVGGVLILPVILLLVGQMFALFFINVYMVLAATVILALFDLLLISVGSSKFGRENILVKL